MRRCPLLLASCAVAAACGGASASTHEPAVAVPPLPSVASSAASDPCSGLAIDFDDAMRQCMTDAERTPPPPPDVLRLSLLDAEVASGEPSELVVRMHNASAAPMSLVFSPGCSFDVSVYDQGGEAADLEGEAPLLGGLCGAGSALSVTLAPNGTLTKRVSWVARRHRFRCEEQLCTEEPGSAIPAGTYRIVVGTPFSDPVDGNEQHRRPRDVSATLSVVAAP